VLYNSILHGVDVERVEGPSNNPDVNIIYRLRNARLSAEERILFYAAYEEGIPALRLARIFENWLEVAGRVEQSRQPTESSLTNDDLRRSRLREAIRQELIYRARRRANEAMLTDGMLVGNR